MTKKSSSKPVSRRSGKPEISRERRLRSEDFDEIDEFAEQRSRIGLEDSEVDSEEEYAAFDEEAILNVPDAQDFDESDGDDDDQEKEISKSNLRQMKKDKLSALKVKSSEKGKKEKNRINRLAAEVDDSDDDILYDRLHRDASDEEENAAAVWGKNRKNYYAEDESADAVEEEAQEARRLQKKKLSALKFDDFVDSGDVDFSKSSSKATSSQKKTLQFDDLDDFEAEEAVDVEDSNESEDISEEDMGDFLALLKDFKERLLLLRTQLHPLLQRAKESKMPTSSGLSFLQLKYHLMLGYCSSVVFYLMLKGRSGVVQGHPVIRKMLKYRLMLEKIRPLEIKMRFQIEKLLQPQQQDGANFRPNPDAMAIDDNSDGADSDEDNGKYRAPKLAPVFYPEDENDSLKAKRDEERRARSASKSRLLSELRGELDDAPEEESIDPVRMAARLATDHKATAREAYEEENFIRFQVSKKEKRRLETAAKPLDELDDLDEFFGELEEINETVAGKNKKKTKKSELIAAYLDEINEGNQDEPVSQNNFNAKYQGSDESDIEDDTKQERSSRSENKRQKRQEKLSNKRESNGPVSYRPVADLPTNTPRPASYSMIKNKGLTPSRTKEQRNPRVKQRTRYEKAIKKLPSSRGGKLSTDTSKPYAGESTGIRTNLTKSVRFK